MNNDSDVTINSVDMSKQKNIKNENSDDTSTSTASAPTKKLNKRQKHYKPQTMSKTDRRDLKKKITIILWALSLATNKLISEQRYSNFWRHKFGINNPNTDECINVLNEIIVKLQCTYISLAALFGDEFISHFEHISSMMIADNEQSWQHDEFWNKIKDKWHAQNKRDNVAKIKNVDQLPPDKSKYVSIAFGNHTLLRHIWDWVVAAHQPDQVTQAINNKKLSQYEISIDLFVLFFELANAMHKFRLCSHTYESTTKTHSPRRFRIAAKFQTWIQNSYQNRNALRTKLIFNSVNTINNKLNDQFTNGIIPTHETKIKLKSLFTHKKNRKYFMDHWHLMCMKFVIFYPIIAIAITGNFEWNKTNFMLPMHDSSKVIKNLAYAHNWKSISNNKITSLPMSKTEYLKKYGTDASSDTDAPQYDYIAATVEQQMKLCVEKAHTIWIHNMANADKKGDTLISDSFPTNINDQIFVMPKSTALASFPPSSWRSSKSKLIYVKTRGASQKRKPKQAKQMTQLRYTRAMCSEQEMKQHQLLDLESNEQTHQIIEKTINHSHSDWEKFGQFGTGLTINECHQTFIKYPFMYPTKPWTYKSINTPPLEYKKMYTWDNLCFGDNSLWQEAKQWQLMKSNEYYHTAQMLFNYGTIGHDTSQYWSSNDSELTDTISDGEEITSDSEKELPKLKPKPKEDKQEIEIDNHIKGFSDGENDECDDSDSLHPSDTDVMINTRNNLTPINELYDFNQEYPMNQFDYTNGPSPDIQSHVCHDNCNCIKNDNTNNSSTSIVNSINMVDNNFNNDKFDNVDTQFGQILSKNIVKTTNFKGKAHKGKHKKPKSKSKSKNHRSGTKRKSATTNTRTAKKPKFIYNQRHEH